MQSISLVIPCFNAAPFLAAALRSALEQTRAPDEIVVIDDGSDDDSAAIAEAVAGPIRVIRTGHRGIGAARNAGIEVSSGALIAFLDADDLWTAHSVETRLRFWEHRPELDYVFGSVVCFDSETGAETAPAEPGRLAGSLLLRRAAFSEIGLFDTALRTGETIDWIGRADAAGYRSGATGEVTLRRRVHSSNTTRTTQDLHADYLRILRRNLARRSQTAERP
jgi:glycosyltransferase involved in cell wall biosynthesis